MGLNAKSTMKLIKDNRSKIIQDPIFEKKVIASSGHTFKLYILQQLSVF